MCIRDSTYTIEQAITDWRKYPELCLLDQYPNLPTVLWIIAMYCIAGMNGILWGYVVSTVVILHVMAMGNSVAHRLGGRNFDTDDNSRNNCLYALLSLGEWHNNHHARPYKANQGHLWWEVDLVYLILQCLAFLRLIWKLR